MTDAKQLLSGSALFEGASEPAIAKLLETATAIHFAAGEIPIAEATAIDRIVMIVRGEVKVEVALQALDQEVKFLRAGPGTFLGLVNFFGVVSQPCTATALTEVEALAWKAEDWRQLCKANPAFGYQLSQRIGRELVERMSNWIDNLLNTVNWVM